MAVVRSRLKRCNFGNSSFSGCYRQIADLLKIDSALLSAEFVRKRCYKSIKLQKLRGKKLNESYGVINERVGHHQNPQSQ